MVQGLPAVKWTAENNHKLLQVLVIIHAGTPDYKKIASFFGPDVPAEAIQYRIRTLRKEGAALGFTGANSSPANSSQRPATSSTGKKASNGRNRKAPANEDIDDDEGMDTDDARARQLKSPSTRGENELSASRTPKKGHKVLTGRVNKARKSPRSTIKKDYMALGDPFVGSAFLNSDGEKIFPTDNSDSDDLFENDKGYDGKYEIGQELEEAV